MPASRTARPSQARHGTRSRYQRHLDDGEDPCEACNKANNAYHSERGRDRRYRELLLELGDPAEARAVMEARTAKPRKAAKKSTAKPKRKAKPKPAPKEERDPPVEGVNCARFHLPRTELVTRQKLIRKLNRQVARDAQDLWDLLDALGLDPRDGEFTDEDGKD
jgi:hypothetical protein